MSLLPLATASAGFGHLVEGTWYPGELGQITLLFGFTIFFTFWGSWWFGRAFPQRTMKSWMIGALKAVLAWMVTILFGFLVPIQIYGFATNQLTNQTIAGILITPFLAESIAGALTFGMPIVVLTLVVGFFYTRSRLAAWFLADH